MHAAAQNDAMRALRVNQNSKIAARQINNYKNIHYSSFNSPFMVLMLFLVIKSFSFTYRHSQLMSKISVFSSGPQFDSVKPKLNYHHDSDLCRVSAD